MNHISISRWLALPLVLLLALVAPACDNPVGSGGGHPEGLVVVNAQGAEVATYLHPTRATTGQLTVAAGSTSSYRIFLLRRDGSRIELDGLEYSIRQVTVNTGVFADASFTGTDQLSITGKTPGPTTLIIDVWHGTHPEFLATVNLLVQ